MTNKEARMARKGGYIPAGDADFNGWFERLVTCRDVMRHIFANFLQENIKHIHLTFFWDNIR
jgi:hypothetical protein